MGKWFAAIERPLALRMVPSEKVTRQHLEILFKSASVHKLSDKSLQLLRSRSVLPVRRRLIVNLKILLDLMMDKDVENTLPGGLTPSEWQLLAELNRANYPAEALTAAYGLLNVPERETVLHTLRAVLTHVRSRDDATAVLQPPVDDAG
jgi:hypothetical protein